MTSFCKDNRVKSSKADYIEETLFILLTMDFTKDEFYFLQDARPMEMKREVIRKMDLLFSKVQVKLIETMSQRQMLFPDGIDSVRGKISKGENYQGLPWMVLDFPKLFTKESTFTLRTFFWWGHGFSTSLIIGNKALLTYKNSLLKKIGNPSRLFLGLSDDPWKNFLSADEQIPWQDVSLELLNFHESNHHFCKLYQSWKLNQAEVLPELITDFFLEAGLLAGFILPNDAAIETF